MPNALPSPRREIAAAIDAHLRKLKAAGAQVHLSAVLGDRAKIERSLGRVFDLMTGAAAAAVCKARGASACFDWVQSKLYIGFDPLKPISFSSVVTVLHELMHVEEASSDRCPMPTLSFGPYKMTNLIETAGPEVGMSERNTAYLDGFFRIASGLAIAESTFAVPAPTLVEHVEALFEAIDLLAELDRLDQGRNGAAGQTSIYAPVHADLIEFLGLDIGFERLRAHCATGAAGDPPTAIARNWAKLGPIAGALDAGWQAWSALSSEKALRRDYAAAGLPGPAIDAIIAHLKNMAAQGALRRLAEMLEKRLGPDAAGLFPGWTLPMFDHGGSADMPGRAEKDLPDLTMTFRQTGKGGVRFGLRLVGRLAGRTDQETLLCGWRIARDTPPPHPLVATAGTLVYAPDMAPTLKTGDLRANLQLSATPPQVFLAQVQAMQALSADPEAPARHAQDIAAATANQPDGAGVVATLAP